MKLSTLKNPRTTWNDQMGNLVGWLECVVGNSLPWLSVVEELSGTTDPPNPKSYPQQNQGLTPPETDGHKFPSHEFFPAFEMNMNGVPHSWEPHSICCAL